jgi:hypothetical protein
LQEPNQKEGWVGLCLFCVSQVEEDGNCRTGEAKPPVFGDSAWISNTPLPSLPPLPTFVKLASKTKDEGDGICFGEN